MALTEQDGLRRNGYCVLPSVIHDAAIARLRSEFHALRTLAQVRPGEDRAEQIHTQVDLQGFLATSPLLLAALHALTGPSIVLITNRHNHFGISRSELYRSGRMHRDALGWTRSYVTILIPVAGFDSATAQLTLIPGSHLWPVAGQANGGGYWLDEGPYHTVEPQALRTNLAVGDALAIDPLLFHAAGHGSPDAPREMLSLAVHGGDELLGRTLDSETLLAGPAPAYRGQSWADGVRG